MDPDRQLFSHRILSRDECISAHNKTANLKELFPCGDSLVCIIDDREDVWNFAPNVVPVLPYQFFSNTGDINSPFKASSGNLFQQQQQQQQEPEAQKDDKSSGDKQTDPVVDEVSPGSETKDEESQEQGVKEVKESEKEQQQQQRAKDSDDYLLHLEDILVRIHTAFYREFDEKQKYRHETEPCFKVPDLKVRHFLFHSII